VSPTIAQLDAIAGRPVDRDNARSLLDGLEACPAGLGQPHRLAQYLAQVMHESAGLQYDHELWGPTTAQKGYEGRVDLGNTEPGDGFRFRGRGPIQITGRANYRAFRDWCRDHDFDPPDFEVAPDRVNEDPWEGLGPIWFWDTRGLNAYADAGNVEMITRRINGGLNGYADRLRYLTRASLVLLGRAPDAVRQFQADTPGLKVDGDAGPATRAALHAALEALGTATTAGSLADQIAALTARVDALEAALVTHPG
jgi:putative chitinase